MGSGARTGVQGMAQRTVTSETQQQAGRQQSQHRRAGGKPQPLHPLQWHGWVHAPVGEVTPRTSPHGLTHAACTAVVERRVYSIKTSTTGALLGCQGSRSQRKLPGTYGLWV